MGVSQGKRDRTGKQTMKYQKKESIAVALQHWHIRQ